MLNEGNVYTLKQTLFEYVFLTGEGNRAYHANTPLVLSRIKRVVRSSTRPVCTFKYFKSKPWKKKKVLIETENESIRFEMRGHTTRVISPKTDNIIYFVKHDGNVICVRTAAYDVAAVIEFPKCRNLKPVIMIASTQENAQLIGVLFLLVQYQQYQNAAQGGEELPIDGWKDIFQGGD